MTEAFIIDGIRTAIGKFGGGLSTVSAVELGNATVKSLLLRTGVEAADIEEVILGCVFQSGLGQNVARQVAINSGLPADRSGMTVNMVCGSGLRAVALAAQAIKAQDASLVIAGGVESMSQAPYLLKEARTGYRMGDGSLVDSMICDGLMDAFNGYHMGITAENVAKRFEISREMQDSYSALSQNKAERAMAEGRFSEEIIPVSIPQKHGSPIAFERDEFPRTGVTPETLARLKPAFQSEGTVTAGNASGVNDGAAVLLVAGAEAMKERKLQPLARIASYAWVGCDPAIMGTGPVEAVKLALRRAGWKLGSIDLIEANEAFASSSLAVAKELDLDMSKVNVNVGAIALGHPLGASGARILVTLLHEMRRQKLSRGLATLCIGGGMGIAMCVEG